MRTLVPLLLRALVALTPTLVVAQAAIPPGPCLPCTDCISGICYQPPPTPLVKVVYGQITLGGRVCPVGGIQQLMSDISPGYPRLPVWNACTCPNAFKIQLVGFLGGAGFPYASGPPPGTPASRPSGSTGPPPIPPYPGGGPWPNNMFYCHPNVFNPYGPSGTTGSGSTGGAPLPPFPPDWTPGRPPLFPFPSGSGTPTPSPPVPFGPAGDSAAIILQKSGCYTKVDCLLAPLSMGLMPAGTIVTFWYVCNGVETLAHSALSNGDGTLNSKNGLRPHTPDIDYWDLFEIYALKPPRGCTVEIRCYQKTC